MRDRAIGLMISGSGRSRTTNLSILLSQGENVLNIGQLRDVWAGCPPLSPAPAAIA